MGALLFDRLSLLRDGIALPDSGCHGFPDLGLDAPDTLRLHAREVTILATPRRTMELVADRVIVPADGLVVTPPTGAAAHTRIVVQRIEGPLHVQGGRTEGRLTVWYVVATPPPIVEDLGPRVEVTRVPDSHELWTRWHDHIAATVSGVTAVGPDLI